MQRKVPVNFGEGKRGLMRVAVGEIEINYVLEGEGRTVVLTHGLGEDLGTWEEAARTLRDRYRVLRWDVRGFGASDAPYDLVTPVTPVTWAADLNGLLEVLEIPSAVIVGDSMGGVIAQRFVLDYAKRTEALILLCTSSEVGPTLKAYWEQHAQTIEEEGMAASGGLAGGRGYSDGFRREHGAEIAAWDAEMLSIDPQAYAAAGRAVSDYRYTEELAAIRCPTLILQGLDDIVTPPGGSVIMSRKIPGAQLEMIENCGHAIGREQGEVMLRHIEAFLAAL